MSEITLDEAEVRAITGYELATKQLKVLRDRGFARAFINRKGDVVLERAHYEAVCRGETSAVSGGPAKRANLGFLKAA